MKKPIILLVLALFLGFYIDSASAAHYIIGIANNALDGQSANGKQVILWNPSVGLQDNLTDIIGASGNSGADNVYMIDCEMLSNPCKVGDELMIKVLNENEYTSSSVNLLVTGAGYDIAPNITLNSIPNTSQISPVNHANLSGQATFNCSAFDFDGLSNISLFANFGGEWHNNETKSVTGTYNQTVFYKNLSQGKYLWGCMVTDNVSISNFSSQNFTLTIDKTAPEISSVYYNESKICGQGKVRVNCSVTDAFTNIDSVIIEARGGHIWKNYSALFLQAGVYYSEILVNETGEWTFNCIANDSAGNNAHFFSTALKAYSSLPDLRIESLWINFSNSKPAENEPVLVDATIFNYGCADAINFLAGFYLNSSKSNQIDENKTLSILGLSNYTINTTWNAEIGYTNFFVFADVSELIFEENESNNEANRTIFVGAWQDIFGNVSLNKILGNNKTYNMTQWNNASNFGGSIFVADADSDINWALLQAIGKNATGGDTNNDFDEIDRLLGMENFLDSTYSLFTDEGIIRQKDSFFVHNSLILNVPVINSTINSNFLTGILWDSYDDKDGDFSESDAEDLVFVTKINRGALGKYGFYDYEITIPARLREYKQPGDAEVYLYYDLE